MPIVSRFNCVFLLLAGYSLQATSTPASIVGFDALRLRHSGDYGAGGEREKRRQEE